MIEITPRICIEGREVDYLEGAYKGDGGLTSAELTFKLPLTYGGMKKLWNKEVTFFLNEFDLTKGGEDSQALVTLDNRDNLDGLTIGAAIQKALSLANLNTKLKTAMIGNTTPIISSVREPIRGTLTVLEVMKSLLAKAIDSSNQTLPRPNIMKIVDDGEYSQLVIELESRLDDSEVRFVFDEYNNIESLNVINKKLPTVITVNGEGVSATFTHDTALEAFDRNYLKVDNNKLKSYAECKEYAARIFQANLHNQYEYTFESFDGAYLSENEVIRIETDDPQFSGNYRVLGKSISFSPSSYSVDLSINRKPPTLAEYISSRDN